MGEEEHSDKPKASPEDEEGFETHPQVGNDELGAGIRGEAKSGDPDEDSDGDDGFDTGSFPADDLPVEGFATGGEMRAPAEADPSPEGFGSERQN